MENVQKKEPSLSIKSLGEVVFCFGKSPKFDPDALVNDALEAFTKAEQKMSEAVTIIDKQIESDEEEIKAIKQGIVSQVESKSRLLRVIERVKAITT